MTMLALALANGAQSGANSSFDPLALAGLMFAYDCSEISSITATENRVSWVNDLSQNVRHQRQLTDIKQPITGTYTLNDRNVIRLDGSNDDVCRNTFVEPDLSVGIDTIGGAVVFKTSDDVTKINSALRLQFGGSNYLSIPYYFNSFTRLCASSAYAGLVYNGNSNKFAFAQNTAYTVVFSLANGAQSVHVNGELLYSATENRVGEQNSTSISLGSNNDNSEYYKGDIGEAFCVARALTPTEISQINQHLGSKWGTH